VSCLLAEVELDDASMNSGVGEADEAGGGAGRQSRAGGSGDGRGGG
jgi:hypothetical protein